MNCKHIAAILVVMMVSLLPTPGRANDDAHVFGYLRSKIWSEVFSDTCTSGWTDKWFLDGVNAKVSNNEAAMTIDTAKGYAVLWTKESFKGDLRIEYDFKRVDENPKGVNIIYIQATGDGQNGCTKDISLWSHRRKLAAMSDYHMNMHTYHISYATDKDDYIRGRRYLPLENKRLKGTELSGEHTKVGLFSDKKWIHVTIIKQSKDIWIEFKHPDTTLLCHFQNKDKPAIEEGRIGLRLMPGRKSQFKNFRVSSPTSTGADTPSRQAAYSTAETSQSRAHKIPTTWPKGQWTRHTIDDSSFGPDGTRLADINGDGLLDITTPWEQGGVVRVYINPGKRGVKDYWPAVTVGEVGDPEDSFFVDLDGDGYLDVVSSCEGETRSMFVHWSPADRDKLLDPSAWTTTQIPFKSDAVSWMYAFAMQVDDKAGIDIVAGSKGKNAVIGWFEAPENPRDMKNWRWHPLISGGWFMTLRPYDFDKDGDLDILATDRRGPRRGALWLENPGAAQATSVAWKEHRIGAVDEHEALHNTIADLDNDGLEDVIVAVKGGPIRYHRRTSQSPLKWETHKIEIPPGAAGAKAVQVADIDLDGQLDLVVVCEHATEGKIGTFWLSYKQEPSESHWTATSISGPQGFINDLVELIDLDHDGDLDVLTVEEKGPYLKKGYKGKELGVIWYENPAR